MKPSSDTRQEWEIAVHISDANWKAALTDIEGLAGRAIKAAIAQVEIRRFAELSLALLSDADVRALNKQYRGKDKPTNVLSFPIVPFSSADIDGFMPLLGDIALGFETVTMEAKTREISLADHVSHLLIHGFYHLQGYDHENDKDASIMESLEIKALAVLGIANPYDKDGAL